jgi:hypothetical protein
MKYAIFNGNYPAPSPVLGWYDTEGLPQFNALLLTDEQWNDRMNGYYAVSLGRLVPYTPPPMNSADAELAALLAQGINLTSTGTPSLNGTYSLDILSQNQVFQIGMYAAQFSQFPSGDSTFLYPDAAANFRLFSVTNFVNFFHAMTQFVTQANYQASVMKAGGTPVWPSNDITIA